MPQLIDPVHAVQDVTAPLPVTSTRNIFARFRTIYVKAPVDVGGGHRISADCSISGQRDGAAQRVDRGAVNVDLHRRTADNE